jgi:parvulin-like peptidyl-prolyl isomerase
MYVALEDYLLSMGVDEVATTITVPEQPHRVVPLKYPELGQRRYLGQQLQVKVRDETTVTESELGSWYEEHKLKYSKPNEIVAHHIFLQTSDTVPTSSTQAQRKIIDRIKTDADKGTSFGLLAEKFSEADSRSMSGAIGRIAEGQPTGPQNRRINAKLEAALFKLKEGEVSPVVETSHGLHLVYAKKRTERVTPTLDELKARGIAGREYIAERMQSDVRRRLDEAKRKSNARILTSESTEITTGTPVIQLGDAQLTLAHIEALYDRLFTRQWLRVRDSKEQSQGLLEQVLEDLLFTQAAEDAGLDKTPKAITALSHITARNKVVRKRNAVSAEAYPVTDEQITKLYESSRDALRQPEAEGDVIVVTLAPHPDTPGQVRAATAARNLIEQAEKLLNATPGISMADVVAKLPSSDDATTSWSLVPRHKLGFSENFHTTAFDQALPGVNEPGQLSAITRVAEAFVIARLKARHIGEPPPFEKVRESFQAQAQSENQLRMKRDLIQELVSKGLLEIKPIANELKEGQD